ncbi:MAG: hypothetical protein CMH48_06855 [Muricauda sp.]|nr:hypothetical protein [Allomuricauda sp.]MAU26927.1 hypothetical protein [Allomuricauda sp.]MBC30550.1 hypothetical protein [Allomuricauda sp.]|tara:strand:+ start:789 stop:1232 length:444 start_codon:yes stop_codon:yes gene_type:complete
MRKVLITMALLAGLTGFAQRHGHHQHQGAALKDMTPEQVATLQTKKMALALDLTQQQQQQVMEIHLKEATERKKKMEERKSKKEQREKQRPSADERFEMANARLEKQLAHQAKMKEILTDEQYLQWKKMNHRRHHGKKRMEMGSSRG